jgi:hypothetical protein
MTWTRRRFSLAVTSLGLFSLLGCDGSDTLPPDFGPPGTPAPDAAQSSEEAYAQQQAQEKAKKKNKEKRKR